MAISDEEARAIVYQQQTAARALFKQTAERALQGDPARRRLLHDAWSPVVHRHDTFTPGEHS